VTPTSPLAGVLTGLAAGLIIALVVASVIWMMNRRRSARTAAVPAGSESVTADRAPVEGEPVDDRKAA